MRRRLIDQRFERIGILVIVSSLVVFLAIAVYGQSGGKSKADPRVEKALKETGYKCEVTSLGNYKLTFKLDDGRGHLVFISSRTEKYGGLETRKIWATVSKSKELLSQAAANKLLMDNVPQKIGAYELTKCDEGGYKVLYSAKVEADCRATSLRDAIRLVLFTADAKEKELTGADEF